MTVGQMTELLFRDDAYLRSCEARIIAADEHGIRLDRTVFYPTGGGQPGDTGGLRLASGETIAIVDTVKADGPDEVIHIPEPGSAAPQCANRAVRVGVRRERFRGRLSAPWQRPRSDGRRRTTRAVLVLMDRKSCFRVR